MNRCLSGSTLSYLGVGVLRLFHLTRLIITRESHHIHRCGNSIYFDGNELERVLDSKFGLDQEAETPFLPSGESCFGGGSE